MISPDTNLSPFGSEPSVIDFTKSFFVPGGVLEKACAGEEFPYEPRPQQRAMAEAVADALEGDHHLAVEAGTGVGKSFAYLVPAIFNARKRNMHVVVSTYTISLQEQLMYKDIPFLQEHMDLDFKAVLVKGRSNYVCLRRLARAGRMAHDLFKSDEEDQLKKIRSWAAATREGSLQDMEEQPSPYVWSMVCAEQGNCMGQKCHDYGHCFFMKARRQVRDAHLLVVNHHLFFSELALRAHGAAFLPPYETVVLDEAHQVEGVASEHFGLRLSHYAFEHWMRRLYVPEGNKGLLAALREGKAAQEITRLWEDVDDLYKGVRKWAKLSDDHKQRTVDEPLSVDTTVPSRLGQLCGMLRDIIDSVKDPDTKAELEAVRRHGAEMRDELEAFLNQTMEDHVYWIEREGRRKQQTVLYSAPVEVSTVLQRVLFGNVRCVVMTSATLAVNGKMDYFKGRVGAYDCEGLSVGSPFNYETQMRMLLAEGMPDPNNSEAFPRAVAGAVKYFVIRSQGRAFVLFTSARLMKAVADLIGEDLTNERLNLYIQGTGKPRHVMLEEFRTGERNVLFGLDSFWMGVDVRGEALSNVIITRLPFAVPDQPLMRARMDRIREKGGDPFKDFSLPEAILKFRQGVGRLIRTANDEGVVIVLDSRIMKKWYGKLFVSSIPQCPIEVIDMA